MFKNYFIVAIRNFWKHKVFTLINVAGLAIGISASLVIYLIVSYEFSYEKFQPNRDRIFRVVTNMHFPNMDFKNGGAPGPVGEAMRREIPGIEKLTQFWMNDDIKVSVSPANEKPKEFKRQPYTILADEEYFSLIPYTWLAGSPEKALDGPDKVVLTESRVKAYFPYTDITRAIGQTITYNDTVNATITGIVKDLDETTDFIFKEFISLPTFREHLKQMGFEEWGSVSSSSQLYVQLQKGTDTAKVNREIAAMRQKHKKDAYLDTDHMLQALSDIHFNAEFGPMKEKHQAHLPTLFGLLAVALFLLLLGCINFINLTTAQASQRAKEIGIRKTMGSTKSKLVLQFLSETFLLTVTATFVSLLLAPWILQIFSEFVPEGLQFRLESHVIVFIIALILVLTVLSGFYPALVLSGFKPVTVLKNVASANTSQSRRVWIRKTLTVAQFVVAQFFIIATLVVSKQIRFSLNKDLGYKKEAIVNFRVPFNFIEPDKNDNRRFALQQKLAAIPGIQQISLAGTPPASGSTSSTTMKFLNKDGRETETTVEVKYADSNYLDLYHMKLVAGNKLQQSDTTREYIVNEALTRFLGYKNPSDIIGRFMNPGGLAPIPVTGVVADFNTKSVQQEIKPLAFTCRANQHYEFHIALLPHNGNTDAWKKTIGSIEKEYKSLYPENDFNYSFFDDSIASFYKKEQQTAGLLKWSTGLAIFISCLGLLGLVTYTTHQRTKEIGVRKVLGASVAQIIGLLSKDYMRLILLAFVIATPLAWWAMHNWLNDYAYRTELNWWIFAVCGIMIVALALLIIAAKTLKAAMENPVKALRSE